jgi:hypothetical protein
MLRSQLDIAVIKIHIYSSVCYIKIDIYIIYI